MNRYIFLLLLALSFLNSSAFGQLSIDQCQEKARKNYPQIKQYSLIEQTGAYNISNANKGYLPQLSFSAQATYQSDVTEIPASLGQILSQLTGQNVTIASMSKDQYKMVAELQQTIWDGGMISSQKEQIKATTELEKQKLEVDLYTIKERVNQIFFGILALNEQKIQIDLLQKELQTNYEKIKAYMQNGVANQADLDMIRVEQLKVKQKKAELNAIQKSYREMLAVMIADTTALTAALEKPVFDTDMSSEFGIKRPELKLFDAQTSLFASQEKMIRAGNLPKLGVFGQGGYGNPGLNMFNPGFTPYYILGAKLTWNFSGLYSQGNHLQKIALNKQTVASQKETFLFNTNLKVVNAQNEIAKIKEQIKSDDEIIALRKNIKKAAEVKVENGTLTVTDLIREINAESTAIQEKALRQIQLSMAVYNLKNITNNQ
ncbi:MAG: TolC family protein [Bacteroidales bacterium]|nr:TolC family protein [Bacteroidales bacterium]